MTTATLLLSTHASSQPPGGKDDHSQALAPGRSPRSRQADLVRDRLREPPDVRHSYRRAFHEAAGEVTRPGNWLRLPAGVSPVSDAPQGVGSTSVPRASNAATTPTTCST